MERKIKFRGKRTDNKWVYGYLSGPENISITPSTGYIVDRKTIGQFSGLSDKDSKEIYDGDIITNSDGVWEVIYVETFAAFYMVNGDEMQGLDMCCRSNKVIGNIHDNPEFMKVKK